LLMAIFEDMAGHGHRRLLLVARQPEKVDGGHR